MGLEFYVLPHKISEYLRTDFPSDVNTQIIRGLCNMLNVNDLYLDGAFLHCNKHHFSMRLSPYQGLKCTESGADMGLIIP